MTVSLVFPSHGLRGFQVRNHVYACEWPPSITWDLEFANHGIPTIVDDLLIAMQKCFTLECKNFPLVSGGALC